ncbi:MAG: hemolysin III family protein [Synergistaceae bacterium]
MSPDKKEITSSVTHMIGAVLALLGTIRLLTMVDWNDKIYKPISIIIFGVSMLVLYLSSATYHWIDGTKERIKGITQRIDHMAIFVLISGTYTPICAIALAGKTIGIWLLCIVCASSLLGFLMKIFWMNAPQWISCGLYVAMGWVSIFALPPLVSSLHFWGIFWLVSGGILYTAGSLIYGFEKPQINLSWFGSHELFHIFVMAGTFCHYITVSLLLI